MQVDLAAEVVSPTAHHVCLALVQAGLVSTQHTAGRYRGIHDRPARIRQPVGLPDRSLVSCGNAVFGDRRPSQGVSNATTG